MNTKTIEKYQLRVVLDRDEVYPDDPGNGTPALVYNKRGANATFWCAMNEGELENTKTGYMNKLTDEQINWLYEIEKEVDDFLYGQ